MNPNNQTDPYPNTPQPSSKGKRYHIVDEDQLRELILTLSPDIRRDTERMADLVRELVNFERQKAGLDNPRGSIELYPNKEKRGPNDPDLIGAAQVAGRFYRAAAWLDKSDKLKIALLPTKNR